MVNPNPARITDEMWRIWEERPNKAWKLGGIYANKKGYHNTVLANKAHWPGTYSIRLPLDLNFGNLNKGRAIDLTMSNSEMIMWTTRMKAAAENPSDSRLAAVREFYGTLDGKNVYGLIKDTEHGKWRRSSADTTHLWHGHVSFFTKYVNNWVMLSPLLSVWRGDTLGEWGSGMDLPRMDESGEVVKYWQFVHNTVARTVNPPSPAIIADGEYGKATAAAFADFWRKSGGKGTFNGEKLTGWLALQYNKALIVIGGPPTSTTTAEQIKAAVDEWFKINMPSQFSISGTLKGTLSK